MILRVTYVIMYLCALVLINEKLIFDKIISKEEQKTLDFKRMVPRIINNAHKATAGFIILAMTFVMGIVVGVIFIF